MPQVTLQATDGLRRGLIGMLRDYSEATGVALTPLEHEQLRVTTARRYFGRARAIGDLLDAIDWTPNDPGSPYTLDVEKHAWAASIALERLIRRQKVAAWSFAEDDEAEKSGEADAMRLQAEEDLAHIQSTCREANFIITEPPAKKPF